MKWFAALLLTCYLAAASYVGSAVFSIGQIVSAVRFGDGREVLGRTKLPRLRHMLIDQIFDAYLDEQGRKRNLSVFQFKAVRVLEARRGLDHA